MNSSPSFRPFENLKSILDHEDVELPAAAPEAATDSPPSVSAPSAAKHPVSPVNSPPTPASPPSDRELFRQAMADVQPLTARGGTHPSAGPPAGSPELTDLDDDNAEVLARLEGLIRDGKGFIVSQTPEYMEGSGPRVHPELASRLHRGDFSIQAHIDLHGLAVPEAHANLERFLKQSILTGKRAVLVVHGRGLSSPAQPVLKTNLYRWLTSGHWRKWVMAFTSAQSFDGGAGATYVLLRQKPLSKKHRKAHPGNKPPAS